MAGFSLGMKILSNLYQYREVVWSLAIRETLVRYRVTWLGTVWTLLPTIVLLGALTVAFSGTYQSEAGGVPYHLFALTGLVPWVFTTAAISRAAASLVGNVDLVTRLYIPREVFPVAAIGSRALDFGLGLILLLGLAAWQGCLSLATCIHLLPVIFVHLLFLMALSLPIAIISVPVRDIAYAMNYIVLVWLFFTPVCYPLSSLTPKRQLLLAFNPMTGLIEAYRDVILRGTNPWNPSFILLSLICLILTFAAYALFRRVESRVVEIL